MISLPTAIWIGPGLGPGQMQGLGRRRAYGAQQLVLRSALEAGWCLARFAMRALTDPKRTCWKLALHAGLLAGRGWAGGQQARVAGYDYENGPE